MKKDCKHGIESICIHCAKKEVMTLGDRVILLEDYLIKQMEQKDSSCECPNEKMIEDMCESIVALKEKVADIQVVQEDCEQECDHVGIVSHMNKWRKKYKKAFKDAETFWKYFFKELREQLEGDYEVEDNDDDEEGPFNHGVCNVLDCTCDCKDCK